MKVLHVITSLDTGGAEVVLERLVSHASTAGIRHAIASLKPPGPVGHRLVEAGATVFAPQRGGVASPIEWLRLRRGARAYRPDLVHGWLVHGNLAALMLARRATPVLWNVRHALDPALDLPRTTRALIRVAARLSHRPRRIVYNTRRGAEHHEASGFAADRRVLIPNGFDTEAFRPDPARRAAVRQELGIAPTTVVIGLVARYDPVKGHEILLEAVGRLPRPTAAVHLVLAGRGVTADNPALIGAIRRHALDGRVALLGERHDVAALYAACDVGVLASRSEGFPVTLGEAMACGLPCVATDVGDAAYLLGDTGRLVPADAPDELSRALASLCDMGGEARKALGMRARARVEEEFSLAGMVQRYEALYRDVLSA